MVDSEKLYTSKTLLSGFTCRVTGRECTAIPEYLARYNAAVEYNAQRKNNFLFFTRDDADLCKDAECPIYWEYRANRNLLKLLSASARDHKQHGQ